jgi:hypothetical protein
MPAASFLEELKTYAQTAVRVASAAARDDTDRALADALRAHIARFRPRPRFAGAAAVRSDCVSPKNKLP